MNTKKFEITSDLLVNLLSTATYGSEWLEVYSLKSESHLDEGKEFDCKEDRWANRLLLGGRIVCFDYYYDDEDGNPTRHELTIDNFRQGLLKARNGSAPRDYWDLIEETSALDYYTCSNLMQVILYGEIIYG